MNRYEIALQVLEKLKPDMVTDFDQAAEIRLTDRQPDIPPAGEVLGIKEYIVSLLPLPEMTLLLGKCEDGLPILVDLETPACGSILISSQSRGPGRYLLKAILASARLLNPGNQVQYSLITSQASFYGELATESQCHQNHHPAHRTAGQYILDVSALVEQRYSGRRRGPAMLLAIDDLEAFQRGSMDEEVFSHLQWIIREGPYVGIWPIVVADLEQDQKSGEELLRQFGTRIFEALHNSARYASKYRPPESLARYPNFEISAGAEILRFAVPAA